MAGTTYTVGIFDETHPIIQHTSYHYSWIVSGTAVESHTQCDQFAAMGDDPGRLTLECEVVESNTVVIVPQVNTYLAEADIVKNMIHGVYYRRKVILLHDQCGSSARVLSSSEANQFPAVGFDTGKKITSTYDSHLLRYTAVEGYGDHMRRRQVGNQFFQSWLRNVEHVAGEPDEQAVGRRYIKQFKYVATKRGFATTDDQGANAKFSCRSDQQVAYLGQAHDTALPRTVIHGNAHRAGHVACWSHLQIQLN